MFNTFYGAGLALELLYVNDLGLAPQAGIGSRRWRCRLTTRPEIRFQVERFTPFARSLAYRLTSRSFPLSSPPSPNLPPL